MSKATEVCIDSKIIQVEISDCDGKFFATSKQVPGFVLCSENRMSLEEDILPALTKLLSIKSDSQNNIPKVFKLPEEIHELFALGSAARDCRDECIESVFRAKRAIFYSKRAKEYFSEAWRMVYELWPEVRGKTGVYDHNERALKITETENKHG